MKGIVLEIKNHTAAVLREDGTVIKLRGNYTVGQTVELKTEPKLWNTKQVRIAFTAAAVILAIGIAGTYNYTTVEAAGIVTVEGASGVQLTLNRRNQVIAVSSTDESGEEMKTRLEDAHIIGTSFPEAVELTRDVYRETSETENPELTFTVTSRDPKMEERMKAQLEEFEKSHSGGSQEPPEGKRPDLSETQDPPASPDILQEPSEGMMPEHPETQEPPVPPDESAGPGQPPTEENRPFAKEQDELTGHHEQSGQYPVPAHEERPADGREERNDQPESR